MKFHEKMIVKQLMMKAGEILRDKMQQTGMLPTMEDTAVVVGQMYGEFDNNTDRAHFSMLVSGMVASANIAYVKAKQSQKETVENNGLS